MYILPQLNSYAVPSETGRLTGSADVPVAKMAVYVEEYTAEARHLSGWLQYDHATQRARHQ
jgi:hypothetical protein